MCGRFMPLVYQVYHQHVCKSLFQSIIKKLYKFLLLYEDRYNGENDTKKSKNH